MSRLHRITGCDEAQRKADVVFVHGLGGEAFETWRVPGDATASWPHWLGNEFAEVGVWSLGYAASPTKWLRVLGWFSWFSAKWRDAGYTMALPHRGRQVLDLFAQEGLGQRPLMFVCHSLGGLVVKQVLRTAKDAEDEPRRRIYGSTRAVLFLATPHSGASLATLIDRFRAVFGRTVTIEDLRAHDAHLQELHDWYRNKTAGIQTRTYFESRPVRGALIVVDSTSAHPGVGADPVPLDEDHISIAKPRSPKEQVYRAAVGMLRDHVLAVPVGGDGGSPAAIELPTISARAQVTTNVAEVGAIKAETVNITLDPTRLIVSRPVRVPLDDAITRHLMTLRSRIEERRISQGRNVQRNLLDLYVEPLGAAEPPPVAADARGMMPPRDPSAMPTIEPAPVTAGASVSTPRDLWSLLRPHLERGKPCAVVADFGTGKSWFLEMAQYRVAGNRLASESPRATSSDVATAPDWVPLLVNLRNFRPAPPQHPGLRTMLAALLGGMPRDSSPFEQIREQAWAAAFGESLAPAQYEDLLRLYEQGQFLFLLDALDEMGAGGQDQARALLSDVGRLAVHTQRSPVLLTVRRSFFRDTADEARLKDYGFEVFYLWPWSPQAQLRAYLGRASSSGLLSARPSEVLASIDKTYDLADLAQRALLAAMLVDQWEDLAPNQPIDLPTIYRRHVDKALLQWQGKKARTLSTADVKRLMDEVAFLMFRLDSLVLSPAELDDYFDKVLARRRLERYSEVAASLVRDIETNSLLVRDNDGFAFCHVSFWEFLVAERLRSALLAAEDAPFAVLQRSQRYESIMKHFLVPMLIADGQHALIEQLFEASARSAPDRVRGLR